MSRRLALLIGTLTLLGAAFVLAPAVAAGDPCFHQMDNRPAASTGSTSQIAIGDCVFAPTVTRVATGTMVTWRNSSIQAHEVVGSNLAWGKHDKLLEPGDTIAWTFDKPGVYGYACMIHPGMTGVVVVGDAIPADAAAADAAPAATANKTTDQTGPSAATVGVASAAGGVGLGFVAAFLLRRRRSSPAG
jgi:plastocyanin